MHGVLIHVPGSAVLRPKSEYLQERLRGSGRREGIHGQLTNGFGSRSSPSIRSVS